jgi:curli production assembly/transport component CsgF
MLMNLGQTLTSMRVRNAAIATAAGAFMIACASGPAAAGTLIYTPTNPSFGGNPNNGAFLLNQANAQNLPLAHQTEAAAAAAAAAGNGGNGGSGALTPGQIFAQQLQAQLLSSFANQITQAIFGANAQQSGTFSFGTTTITFGPGANGTINISINDGQTITTITVPANP